MNDQEEEAQQKSTKVIAVFFFAFSFFLSYFKYIEQKQILL